MIICNVKNCENNALVMFGTKWICGKCYTQILKQKQSVENKLVDELIIEKRGSC